MIDQPLNDEPTTAIAAPVVRSTHQHIRWIRLVLLLGGLMALGPLSIDMYLPALPGIRAELDVSPATAQLTITGVMVGMGLGQLIIGPLSDVVGRRRPLVAGLIAYLVGCLLCVLSPTAALFVTARIIQGLAMAATGVIATATVRDLFSGRAVARVLSRLMIIPMAAPLIAPTIGGAVLTFASWRGIFVVLAGIGILIMIITAFVGRTYIGVGESRQAVDPRSLAGHAVRSYRVLLHDRQFVACAVLVGGAMAAMLGYVAGAPFVLEGRFGLNAHQFGIVFGLGGLSLIIAGQLNAQLLRRFAPDRILRGSTIVGLGAVGWLMVTATTGWGGLPGLLAGLWLMVGVIGMIFPNAPAVAMSRHRERAGSAAALIGAVQFCLGSIGPPPVGLLGNSTVAMALVCTTGMLLATGAALRCRTSTARPTGLDGERELVLMDRE